MHIVVIVHYSRECFRVSGKAENSSGLAPDLVQSRMLEFRWLTILHVYMAHDAQPRFKIQLSAMPFHCFPPSYPIIESAVVMS